MLKRQVRSKNLRKAACHSGQITNVKGIDRDKVEIWFTDEARIGQKNNVWPAPSASSFQERLADQSASTYPASETCSQPRWRYAQSGPHKIIGI
jgi:hypothetical protein